MREWSEVELNCKRRDTKKGRRKKVFTFLVSDRQNHNRLCNQPTAESETKERKKTKLEQQKKNKNFLPFPISFDFNQLHPNVMSFLLVSIEMRVAEGVTMKMKK